MNGAQLRTGLACTLAAGMLWGMVFIAPVLLPTYPAVYLSVARYLAFGIITLVIACFDWRSIAQLSRADWLSALELALIGNLLYYGFLAAAIQTSGAPLPTMIIGALPVVISLCANFGKAALPWSRLILPLALIGLGISLVQQAEWQHIVSDQKGQAPTGRFWLGAALALCAVACWTWYPIRNSLWLQKRPQIRSTTWATAQGLATLPLALIGLAILLGFQFGWFDFLLTALKQNTTERAWRPFGDTAQVSLVELLLGKEPLFFLAMMLAIGLGASWLGTLLWNRASQVLPASLTGQLIVFETLFALLYAFIHRGQWPSTGAWFGIAALVVGVVFGVRAFQQKQLRQH